MSAFISTGSEWSFPLIAEYDAAIKALWVTAKPEPKPVPAKKEKGDK